jgi:hypothetical protein
MKRHQPRYNHHSAVRIDWPGRDLHRLQCLDSTLSDSRDPLFGSGCSSPSRGDGFPRSPRAVDRGGNRPREGELGPPHRRRHNPRGPRPSGMGRPWRCPGMAPDSRERQDREKTDRSSFLWRVLVIGNRCTSASILNYRTLNGGEVSISFHAFRGGFAFPGTAFHRLSPRTAHSPRPCRVRCGGGARSAGGEGTKPPDRVC